MRNLWMHTVAVILLVYLWFYWDKIPNYFKVSLWNKTVEFTVHISTQTVENSYFIWFLVFCLFIYIFKSSSNLIPLTWKIIFSNFIIILLRAIFFTFSLYIKQYILLCFLFLYTYFFLPFSKNHHKFDIELIFPWSKFLIVHFFSLNITSN